MSNILRRQLAMIGEASSFRGLSRNSGFGDYGHLIGPCAEDDTEMLADMSEANALSVELQENLPQVDAIEDVAQRAEDAAGVFTAAADTIEAGGDVSEAAIAQADSIVVGAIEDAGETPVDVVPEIETEERTMVTGESANGTLKFRPGYTNVRKNPVVLRLAGESVMTWAKNKWSQAINAMIKLYEKICQWVGKYIGTFPNMLKRAKNLKDAASKMSGKKQEDKDWEVSGSLASQFTVPAEGSEKPVYMKSFADVSKNLEVFKSITEALIEEQRGGTDDEQKLMDGLSSADWGSDDHEAIVTKIVGAWGEIVTSTNDITTKLKGNYAWELEIRESVKKTVVAKGIAVLPGYKRLILVEPNTTNGSAADKLDATGADITTAHTAYKNETNAATKKTKATALLETVEKYANAMEYLGLKVVDATPSGKTPNLNTEITLKVPTAGQVEDMASSLIKMLEDWIAFRSSKRYLKHLENMRKYEKLTNKATERFNKASSSRNNDSTTPSPDVANKLLKMVLGFVKIPTKLVNEMKVAAELLLKFYDACIQYGQRGLAAYVAND